MTEPCCCPWYYLGIMNPNVCSKNYKLLDVASQVFIRLSCLNSVVDGKLTSVKSVNLCIQLLIRDSQAYGVEFIRNNTVRQSRARKEVILSAGAIGSPQILMLSGIGPRKHLESLDVSSFFV